MPETHVMFQNGQLDFPIPDIAAQAHSARLVDRIHAEIAQHGGRIGFDRYMEMALYEPGLGYYSAGAGKFGADGDFVTAPELSPLFSVCLAQQCREILDNLNGGVILELGAGSGRMAVDVLRELLRTGAPPARYLILETSADLRQRQQQLLRLELPEFFSSITWLDRLPEQPLTGVILANEVLDALPVRRVTLRQGELLELLVCRQGGGFAWASFPADPALRQHAMELERSLRYPWPDGYTTEICTALAPWLASLADVLHRGVMLLIDYGYTRSEYYHPDRADGTLLCHYRHRVHNDPFLYPGLQDVTASVDFTAVAEAAVAAGLDVAGYTTQGYFLCACGLDEIQGASAQYGSKRYLELTNQVKRLTLPGEMGERFKVIGLVRGIDCEFTGFSMSDQRQRL